MSRLKNPNRSRPGPTPPAQRISTRTRTALIVGGMAVVAVAAFFLFSREPVAPPADGASMMESKGPETASPAPAAAASEGKTGSELRKVLGKWLRPDGGYNLELKKLESAGRLEAAYFNPSPINVARAYAWQDGTATKVFVELRDVNYPGCTYTLTYDPKRDMLHGIYFQAAMGQEFEVVFVRSE